MMDDGVLAALVAADLRRNLAARAPSVRDVYGFCLWVDDVYGVFIASFNTEAEFQRQRRFPAYAAVSDEVLYAPSGIRWSVGDWYKSPDDDFVTDDTQAALEPLVLRVNDLTLTEEEFDEVSARWRELAFATFELARPLDLLPCTDDAIAFVGIGDGTVDERVEVMARTVPASRLETAFAAPSRPAAPGRAARRTNRPPGRRGLSRPSN